MIVVVVAAAYLTGFVGVEILSRQSGLDREVSRKLVHVTAGLSAAPCP